jgi:hypothetical protein
VHGVIAQSPSGAWSSGGAILTFLLPMLLVIIVAVGLYIVFTKPSVVPGRRAPAGDHPVSYTPIPGKPIVPEVSANPTAGSEPPVARTGRWRRKKKNTGTEAVE